MDINKLLDIISNNNINQKDVFSLIEIASNMNLKDEKNIRELIRRGAKIVKKSITKEQEDEMVKLIMTKGITPDLLNLLNA